MHDEVPSEWCLTFLPFFSGRIPVGTPATSSPLDAQRAAVPLIRAYTRRTVLSSYPHYELALDVNFQFSLHCRVKGASNVCIAERRDHRKGEAILFALGLSRNRKRWGPFRVRPPCDTGPRRPKSWHFPCPKQSLQVP